MKRRPDAWNEARVPHGETTEELVRQGGDGPTRWAAFAALAQDPSSQARAALREAAHSEDPYVRRAAIEALACHPSGSDQASVVLSALDDPDATVVRTACHAAAKLSTREAHGRVIKLIQDSDASTREVAVTALRTLWEPDDFRAVFEVFRKDSSPSVRREAAWTLRQRVAEETWQPLFEAWHRDPLHRHRIWACEIAGEFGGPQVAEQLSLLTNDQDGHVRRAAKNALSAIESV